jgi:uncharacterized protein
LSLVGGADGVWVADEREALAVADEVFVGGQVVAVSYDQGRTRAGVTRFLRRGPDGRHVAVLDRPETAAALDLLPHPEGGWFRETWRSDVRLTPEGYSGERVSATGIYFLLPPGEESMWHVVRSDEVWLWHRGGPLTLRLGREDTRVVTLGPDLAGGQRPQVVVPGGTWQAAGPAADREVLVSCVVSPGFDFADFQV